MIPYGRQDISEQDIQAVVAALRSDRITQGPAIDAFENAVADYCGARHAIAVANGTAALHLACLALEISSDDTVWTTPNTFVASANCARYCGAAVDFVDIDPKTYNLSVAALRTKLEAASKKGRLPTLLIPVHFAGQSCDMAAIAELAREYGFKIIEDASHAIGGDYAGDKIGGCRHAQMTVFSFHPVKIITSGEGGMVTTNNPELARRLGELRTHGITRDPQRMQGTSDGPWYYQQIDLGFNYRITDLQAALGASQMQRIDDFIEARHELRERYDSALSELPLILPSQSPEGRSALHLYPVQVKSENPLSDRRAVFEHLSAAGIGVNVHYIPVYRQPYYASMGFNPADYPNAEAYYSGAISLPLFPTLSRRDQDFVVDQLAEALNKS